MEHHCIPRVDDSATHLKTEQTKHMKPPKGSLLLLALLVAAPSVPGRCAAQEGESAQYVGVLQREYPATYDLLIRTERAHGVLFGALAEEGDAVRATGEDVPTFGFELDMVDRLTQLVQSEGTADDAAAEATAGFRVLGERAAAIIAYGNAFYREVLGILADPTVVDRRAALVDAVARYESRPDVALPTAPKSMDILYDHPYHEAFRRGYLDLDGVIWAGHWMKLAATEPLTDLRTKEERAAGLDTVMTRYYDKLSYGDPPQFFPSELPMAPAICPGLIFLSTDAAMIWDNLTMMQEVLADVLAAPDVEDVRAALDATVDHFMDATFEITDEGGWESMALAHGIFFQGGYPLAVMTKSELNVGGHAAHLRGGGHIIIPGMPG